MDVFAAIRANNIRVPNIRFLEISHKPRKGSKLFPTIFDLAMNGERCNRFLYHVETRELLVSPEYVCKTHADLHYTLGANRPYDEYIKGWHSIGPTYPYGVIHFHMWDYEQDPVLFDQFMCTLELFATLGAEGKSIVRSPITEELEAPLREFLPKMFN